MSLLSKLEKLEKVVASRRDASHLEPSPELLEDFSRILREIAERPEPTIHERIAWLRDRIRRNEELSPDDLLGPFLPEWCRAELERLEAEVAKLQ